MLPVNRQKSYSALVDRTLSLFLAFQSVVPYLHYSEVLIGTILTSTIMTEQREYVAKAGKVS